MRPCMRPCTTLHASLATLYATLAGGKMARRQGRIGSSKGRIPPLSDPDVSPLFMRVLGDTGSQDSALSINDKKRKKGGYGGAKTHIKESLKVATLAPLQQPRRVTRILRKLVIANIIPAITALYTPVNAQEV
jgi:hypothetical protein